MTSEFRSACCSLHMAGSSDRAACGRSPAANVGSNPTACMDVCLVTIVCCQVEVSATS
jgi:hypothetical protein